MSGQFFILDFHDIVLAFQMFENISQLVSGAVVEEIGVEVVRVNDIRVVF